MKKNLIGLSGKKGSGKDEVYAMIDFICSVPDGDFAQYKKASATFAFENRKFAGPLKRMVCQLIGCTEGMLENRKFKNTPLIGWSQWRVVNGTLAETFPVRSEAQALGDLWESYTSKKSNIVELEMTPRKMLQLLGTEGVRDVLHTNAWVLAAFSRWEPEDKWIFTDCRFPNEANAIKNRGGLVIRIDKPGQDTDDMHASETALDSYNFDIRIDNSGTLEDLFNATKAVCHIAIL